MKKILLLTILCLLLTGCTVNYNLEIDDNEFKETITGNVLNSEMTNKEGETYVNLFHSLINNDQQAIYNNSNSLYKKTLKKQTDSVDFEYTYTYNDYTINDSILLDKCFKNFSIESENNQYKIMTYGDFYCKYADEIKVNITTEYQVTLHNADKVKDNTYTWIINDETVDDFEIILNMNKEKIKEEKSSNFAWSPFKTIVLILMLLVSGACIFIMHKKEQQY